MVNPHPPVPRMTCEALVVGAGIAGAVAAAHLLDQGREVIVIDRAHFPRPKVCGGCLQPRAVAALERAGFGEALRPGRPVERVRFHFGGGVGIPLLLDERRRLTAVGRETLDAALVGILRDRGAQVLEGVTARGTRVEGSTRVVDAQWADGSPLHLEASVVLACDGLASRLARCEGLTAPHQRSGPGRLVGMGAVLEARSFPPGNLPPGELRMGVHRVGYIGLVRIEEGRLDVAAAVDGNALKELGKLKLLKLLLGAADLGTDQDDLNRQVEILGKDARFSPPLGTAVRRVTADRLLLVGDAAGYREPITGEGMAWAARSAEDAAACLSDGWSDISAERYERRHRSATVWGLERVRVAGFVAGYPRLGRQLARALALVPARSTSWLRWFVAPADRWADT